MCAHVFACSRSSFDGFAFSWLRETETTVFLFVQFIPCCFLLMALSTELILSISCNTCPLVTDMKRTRQTEKSSQSRLRRSEQFPIFLFFVSSLNNDSVKRNAKKYMSIWEFQGVVSEMKLYSISVRDIIQDGHDSSETAKKKARRTCWCDDVRWNPACWAQLRTAQRAIDRRGGDTNAIDATHWWECLQEVKPIIFLSLLTWHPHQGKADLRDGEEEWRLNESLFAHLWQTAKLYWVWVICDKHVCSACGALAYPWQCFKGTTVHCGWAGGSKNCCQGLIHLSVCDAHNSQLVHPVIVTIVKGMIRAISINTVMN